MTNNDYLNCEGYAKREAYDLYKGFSAFVDETTQKNFFALIDAKGKVLLRSEGYPTLKARNTGIASVVKNGGIAERYSVLEEAGKFLVVLKAGNNKEIARSCELASKKEADTLLKAILKATTTYAWAAEPAKAEEPKVEAKKETPAKKVAATKEVAKKEATKNVEVKKEEVAPKATKKVTPKVAEKSVEPTVMFLSEELYLGHPTIEGTGYASFKGNDEKFYFSVYEFDGSLFQCSCGFDSQDLRDSQLARLQNAIVNEDRYQISEIDDKYYALIVDESGNELSRSAGFDTYIQALLKTPKGWVKEEFVGNLY